MGSRLLGSDPLLIRHGLRQAQQARGLTPSGGLAMHRRQVLKAGLAWPLAFACSAYAKDPIYIADMHYHLFFQGRNPASANPLAKNMAGGNASLVAWSLVGDLMWMGVTPRGFRQKSVPKPGETVSWFQRELARIKAHVAE